MDEFENKVRELVADYGAPENISEEIANFLLDSCNVYRIVELYRDYVGE